MREEDLALVAAQPFRFRIGEKIFLVKEPNLKTIIQHEAMRGKHLQESLKLREAQKFEKAFQLEQEYVLDELQLYIPELTRDEALSLTKTQIQWIMKKVDSFNAEEEEKEGGTQDTKKKE